MRPLTAVGKIAAVVFAGVAIVLWIMFLTTGKHFQTVHCQAVLIIYGGALAASAIIYVIWTVFVVWAVKKGTEAVQADMNRAQQLLQTYGSMPKSRQVQMKPELLRLLASTNAQLQQMDHLRRQQYEVKVGELHSMAAQAGIDWTPPSY
jgi:hypothetical protein